MARRTRTGTVKTLAGTTRKGRCRKLLILGGRNDWRRLCRMCQGHLVSVLRRRDSTLDLIFYTGAVSWHGNWKGVAGSMHFTITRERNPVDCPCRPGNPKLFAPLPDSTRFCRLWRRIHSGCIFRQGWIWRRRTASRITFVAGKSNSRKFYLEKKCLSTTLLTKTIL